MPSETITGMPAITEVNDSDVFPVVQGGINYKAERQQILKASSGLNVRLDSSTCRMIVDDTGLLSWEQDSGTLVDLKWDGNTWLGITSSGGISLNGLASKDIDFNNGGSKISVKGSGDISIVQSPGATIAIDFTPLTSSDWKVSDPTTIEEAIDRIASAVAILLGGPIS